MSQNSYRLSVDQIQKFIPHRAPFLLIDRILEIETQPNTEIGTKVIGLKNVTYNESYMQGHFPGMAIMPGVLIVEAMAQTSCFALYPKAVQDLENFASQFQSILAGINSVRFRKPVVPGDTLRLEAVVSKQRGSFYVFDCMALVEGVKVADASLTANLFCKKSDSEGEN
jgi:beta-hydroxyacyl-ACP dehydratase FabZ